MSAISGINFYGQYGQNGHKGTGGEESGGFVHIVPIVRMNSSAQVEAARHDFEVMNAAEGAPAARTRKTADPSTPQCPVPAGGLSFTGGNLHINECLRLAVLAFIAVHRSQSAEARHKRVVWLLAQWRRLSLRTPPVCHFPYTASEKHWLSSARQKKE